MGVIPGLMRSITDRFGTTYTVTSTPMGESAAVYHVLAVSELVARAYVRADLGYVREVLVYRHVDRRRGIASAFYALIEGELGQPLRPSRIRSKAGRAFWARRLVIQAR
jgi:hypothetical protein